MKRNSFYVATTVLAFAVLIIFSGDLYGQRDERRISAVASPQSIFVENFNYPAGTLLTANGWTNHSGTANFIPVSASGLTYSGWPSSGNAATMTNTGEDVNHQFGTQSAGSVYAGVVANVSAAGPDATNGDYFFHLGPDPLGSTFRGRVFVKQDANNMLAFGISKGGSNAAPASITYTGFVFPINTSHLLIVKYSIIAGATNDTVELFVNPTLGGAEPAVTVTAPDVTATDVNPGTVALRQGTTASSPTLTVDGIRISNSWASLLTGATFDAPVDFNGDGRTDFVVARNTGGQVTWFWNLSNSANPTAAAAWGLNTDTLTPADFDGDLKDDIAVWRSGAALTAAFYILQSQTNTVRVEQFGQTNDDPTVVNDYNGDGRDDVAVYRPGTQGVWYYRTVANGPVTFVPWGTTGDFVAPGDYNGDGIADFGVRRNNGGAGNFWVRLSTGAVQPVVSFGLSTDTVITSDFDGDGRSDLAVARGVGGAINWYWRPSSGGADQQVTFGLSIDLFAPGDYNGDGRTDPTVFRDGVFYSLNTVTGVTSFFSLGATGDRVPAAYNIH